METATKGKLHFRAVLLSCPECHGTLKGELELVCSLCARGYPVVDGSDEIGVVTSGTHSPTLKKAIGLAYLPLDKSAPGTEFMVLIRGKETRARVVPTPFYKRAK